MMENNYEYVQESSKNQGSILGGVFGALLGSAIGAVAWAAVGMMGYIASIIGFVIAFLADKGYDLCKGRQGTVKMIVLIICVILAVAVGTVATTVWQIHNEYNALSDFEKEYYYPAEPDLIMQVLADEEVQSEIFKNGAMGLVFGILGAIGLIRGAKNGRNSTAAVQPASPESAIEMASVPARQEASAEAEPEKKEQA